MGWIKRHFKFLLLIMLVAFTVGALTGSTINVPQLSEFFNKPFRVEQTRSMIVPGVDENGNGVASLLTVTVKPGTGQVLVNINNVLAGFDTQDSAKIAALEAAKYTDVDINTLDIIYSIKAGVPLVSGTSAGAAMAVATIAAIDNKVLNPKVSITGAINNESKIIEVGSIKPKAIAVKEQGIEIFLVPSGQGTKEEYQRTVNCETIDSTEICQTKYSSTDISIGEKLGTQIIEVATISDAVSHFLD